MRFAGEGIRNERPEEALIKPIVPNFNAEDLQMTPEMTPGRTFSSPYEQEYLRDRYIRHNPGSGVAMLPNGEQGPSQGPNTPIKNYGGKYMPNGSEPSGYKPGPNGLMAFNPIGMMKFQMLKQAVEGQPLNPGTVMSPKMEQEIYQPELTAPQQIRSPQDDNFMEMMKSGFV